MDNIALWLGNCIAAIMSIFYCVNVKKLHKTNNWIYGRTICALFITWYTIFAIFIVVPIDMISNSDTLVPNFIFVERHALYIFWNTINACVLVSSWIILPLVSSYNDSGEFTILSKLWYSIKDNTIVYISISIPLAICMIYLIVKDGMTATNIFDAVIAASNTWGLTIYIIYLGYGIVNVIKNCYHKISYNKHMDLLAVDVNAKSNKMYDMYDAMQESINSVNNLEISSNSELNRYVQIVVSKIPLVDHQFNNIFTSSDSDNVTKKELVKIHTKLLKNVRKFIQHKTAYDVSLLDGVKYNKFMNQKLEKFNHMIYLIVFPICYSICAIYLTAFSFLFIWSQITDTIYNTNIDVFALFTSVLIRTTDLQMVFYFFVISSFFVISLFTFHGINNYEYSLMTTSKMKIRLIIPLCLNFLNVCKSNDTVFGQTIGKYTLLTFVQKFELYYPILLLIVCLLALFKVVDKLICKFGLSDVLLISEANLENIQDGMSMIKREQYLKNRNRDNFELYQIH